MTTEQITSSFIYRRDGWMEAIWTNSHLISSRSPPNDVYERVKWVFMAKTWSRSEKDVICYYDLFPGMKVKFTITLYTYIYTRGKMVYRMVWFWSIWSSKYLLELKSSIFHFSLVNFSEWSRREGNFQSKCKQKVRVVYFPRLITKQSFCGEGKL